MLVIEDDRSVLEALTDTLSEYGYDVVPAESADQGWTKLAPARPPDCVILDWLLPGMSGQQFVDRLRKDRRLKSIPVIVISGAADLSDVSAQVVLKKPFELKDLLSALRTSI